MIRHLITTTDADVDDGYQETRIEVFGDNSLNSAIEAAKLCGVPFHRLTLYESDSDQGDLNELGDLASYLGQ